MTRYLMQGAGMLLALALGASAGAHTGHDAAMGSMAPASAKALPAAAGVSASACWIRQLPAPVPSGGFLVVHNRNAHAVTLIGAHSPDYGQVMLHKTDESGGMSRMAMVSKVAVPADGELAFKSGSYHVMLEQPRTGLKPGDQVDLVFVLDDQTQFTAQCAVKPANTIAP